MQDFSSDLLIDYHKQMTTYRKLNSTFFYSGEIQDYNADYAFYVDIEPNNNSIYHLFSVLDNTSFLSKDTSLIQINLNSYNYNRDIFTTLIFTFERNIDGATFIDYKICVITNLVDMYRLFKFELSFLSIFNIVSMILLFGFTLHSYVKIIVDIFKEGILKYFSEFFKIIKFVLVIFYTLHFTIKFLLYNLITSDILNDNSDFKDTTNVCNMNQSYMLINALMICLIFIYFLKFLDKNIVNPIFKAMFDSSNEIIMFLVCYLLSIIALSIFINYIFAINIIGNLKK